MVVLIDLCLLSQFQRMVPLLFIKIQQHFLLQLISSVVNVDRVIIFIQSFIHSFNGGFIKIPIDRGSLPGLLTRHGSFHIDKSKSINDDFSPDGLYGVDDNSHTFGVELLERLLCVNIHTGEPAPETGMRVIPSDNVLVSLGLLKHIEHILLIDWIDGLD